MIAAKIQSYKRGSRRPILLALAAIGLVAWMNPGVAMAARVHPFFAPPQPTGILTVTLQPTEGVSGTRLVTFGVAFPRGSVAPADLARVRVLKAGSEIPAYVEAQTPWRHATNSAVVLAGTEGCTASTVSGSATAVIGVKSVFGL